VKDSRLPGVCCAGRLTFSYASTYQLLTALIVAAAACVDVVSAAGPPSLDLAKWNAQNKYIATSVPAALFHRGAALFDGGSANVAYQEPLFPLVGYDVQRQCRGPKANLAPTQAKPGTCQYKPNKDGTFTYW